MKKKKISEAAAIKRVNKAAIELLVAESELMETPITEKEADRFISELLDIAHTIVHDVVDSRGHFIE